MSIFTITIRNTFKIGSWYILLLPSFNVDNGKPFIFVVHDNTNIIT